MKQILYTKGENPIAMLTENGLPYAIIEEKKIIKDRATTYPEVASNILWLITGKRVNSFEECEPPKICNGYLGLEYDNDYCMGLVRQEGLFYYMYDSRYGATPTQFFNDIKKMLEADFRVGWFQGRWKYGKGIDYNRVIMKGTPSKITSNYLCMNLTPILIDMVNHIGVPKIFSNMDAFIPVDAIKLVGNKIDALVIGNIICAKSEEGLKCLRD